MQIESGLFPHMVLQRNAQNVSQARVAGACSATGEVLATIRQDNNVLEGWGSCKVGTSAQGCFAAEISGLPSGGPYDIALSVDGTETMVEDVLVGDVWMLGGQSNMQGMGLLTEESAQHPEVRAFYMDDRWEVARDPIHNMKAAVAPCHSLIGGGGGGNFKVVGPGIGFGIEMRQRRGVPQGLICSAHGGTSMTQWQPDFDVGNRCLYGAMLERFKRNGCAIAGMIWYQGESDAKAEAVDLYTQRFERMMAAFRSDTGLPVPTAMVQIARIINASNDRCQYWNQLQEQQRLMSSVIADLATVPAIDLALHDGVHIAGSDQPRLGRRLADCMQHLTGESDGVPPISLAGIKLSTDIYDRPIITVSFDNVVGGVQATGRPWGFHVEDVPGQTRVCDTSLEGNSVHLLLPPAFTAPQALTKPYTLSYGFGTNSYCNITDNTDRSLPVFGPLPIL